MKKDVATAHSSRRFLLGVLAVAVFTTSLSAQIAVDRPRVGVLPFANLTGTIQSDAIARTTSDTVLLTLRLVGAYEVVEIPAGILSSADMLQRDTEGLDEAAARAEVDSIIYGAVSRQPDGPLFFELRVYDRGQGAVTVQSESIAESLFDVFDAADELVAQAVGGFSGIRIGFGSLSVRPQGEGTFRLYVDGELIGDNVTALDRLLIGERAVSIAQVRGDREVVLVEEQFNLEEGESRAIAFVFPRVTEEETARELELNHLINRNLAQGINLADVEAALDELNELYGRLGGAFDPGAERVRWYRARLEVARSIADIVAIDFADVARSDSERAREAVRTEVDSILLPWRDALTELEPEADLPWSQEQLEFLRIEIRRNLTVFNEIAELTRIGISEQPATQEVRNLSVIAPYLRVLPGTGRAPLTPFYANTAETRAGIEAAGSFDRADARRRPLWHWLGWVSGGAGIGAALYLNFGDIIPQQEQSVTAALTAYDGATTVDEARQARADLDSRLLALNFYETLQIGGLVAGGAIVAAATIARIASIRRPERIWNRYLDAPYIRARRATGIAVRDRAWETGDTAILILGNNRPFDAGTGEGALTTPQYITAQPGQEFTIVALGVGDPDRSRRRFTVQQGLNVVMLEDM